VDGSLGEHGVVLELTLAERRSVGRDDDQLGLAGTQGLDGRLVAQGDCNDRTTISSANQRRSNDRDPFLTRKITYPFQTSSQAPGAS
jgi:hypothetical protein